MITKAKQLIKDRIMTRKTKKVQFPYQVKEVYEQLKRMNPRANVECFFKDGKYFVNCSVYEVLESSDHATVSFFLCRPDEEN